MCVQRFTKVDPYHGKMDKVCHDVLHLQFHNIQRCNGLDIFLRWQVSSMSKVSL